MVQADDQCHLCRFPLLTRASYLFPCGHRFHGDCLLPKVLAGMSQVRRDRVHDLQRELASLPGGGVVNSNSDTDSLAPSSLSLREQLLQDLDDVIASDCLYCGEAIIRFECNSDFTLAPFNLFHFFKSNIDPWMPLLPMKTILPSHGIDERIKKGILFFPLSRRL